MFVTILGQIVFTESSANVPHPSMFRHVIECNSIIAKVNFFLHLSQNPFHQFKVKEVFMLRELMKVQVCHMLHLNMVMEKKKSIMPDKIASESNTSNKQAPIKIQSEAWSKF